MGARFHANLPQTIPDPDGLLLHREIATLVNIVQVVTAKGKRYAGAQPGTISPLSVLAIQHTAVAGQMRSTSVVLHHPPLCCI